MDKYKYENKHYDYAIIGGGVTGLTLAYYLSKNNKKVILIEKDKTLGGNHRVDRVNGLFTEHGPRVYLNNYHMIKKMLKEMKSSFYDFFIPYNFSLSEIGGKSSEYFNMKDIYWFSIAFMNLNKYKKVTLETYLAEKNFSNEAIWYIDRLCRLSDGAGIERYTVFQFMQIINQNTLYNTYQPKLPNDIGLLKFWKKILEKQNVDILLEHEAINFNKNNVNNITDIIIRNNNILTKIKGTNFILAIQPYALTKLVKSSSIPNAFGDINKLIKWEKKTRYLTYISVIFHWDTQLNLPKVWGFPKTEWGIAFVVLSNYMKFQNKKSKTVISTCITIQNKSSTINKIPNECTKEELINEVYNQLKISFPHLPKPTASLLTQNHYNTDNKTWESNNNAFIATKDGYIDNYSKYNNLYTCGAHNGNSEYNFTSLETSVQNALALLNKFESSINKKPIHAIIPIKTLATLIKNIIIIILLIIVIYMYS
jgi:hypothetical protein